MMPRCIGSSWRAYGRRSVHLWYGEKSRDSLRANDGLLVERLPENDTLVAPFEALLSHRAAPSDDGAAHGPSLMVEVAHDDLKAVVFRSQEPRDWHLDVLELDVSCTCCRVNLNDSK